MLGRRTPSFDHRKQLLSQLGQKGARYQRLTSYGVFLPVGLGAFGLGSWFLAQRDGVPAMRGAAGLALCIAVGYVAAALFPYQPRDQRRDALAFWVHELGGAVEYFGGGAALAVAAWDLPAPWSTAALVSGLVIWIAGLCIGAPRLRAWRGTVQRLGELVLFSALIAFAGSSG